MSSLRLALAIICLALVSSVAILPESSHTRAEAGSGAETDSAPVAVDDTYTVHGGTQLLPSVLANDSGDGIRFNSYGSQPQHGNLVGSSGQPPSSYAPHFGYTGTDSFTYNICDDQNDCSNFATVTLNVNNNAPVAVGDLFVVHGAQQIPSVLLNDHDPDGDGIQFDLYGSQGSGE